MPIYEYKCSNCGELSEFIQKVNEPVKTECPLCHKEALSKVISATSFQLKGSGWYVTDFRNKNKTAQKTDEKPAADSKPETKSEASDTTPKPTKDSTDKTE